MRRISVVLAVILAFGLALSLNAVMDWGGQARAAGNLQANSCQIQYDKQASPSAVDSGGIVTVTLSLQSVGDCTAANSAVDVILVIDRSGSMSGQSIADAKQAAINFVNQMDLSADQVGVVSFASSRQGRLDQQLSQDAASIIQSINRLFAGGMTDMVEGLEIAEAEMLSTRHQASNAPVIVILSDGKHNESGTNVLRATADRIKGRGFRIISIGLGNADANQLRSIASSQNDYYYAPNSSQLAGIYQSIAGSVRVSARDMTITDTLSSDVSLAPGSFQGPISPTVMGNQIFWYVSAVPTATLRLSYQVVMPAQAGVYPTNDSAIATYIDASGAPASLTFPVPQVTVRSACGQPTLNNVAPAWACQATSTNVILQGGGFKDPTASIGGLALTGLDSNERIISATLPAGLSIGVYTATVTNQCVPTPFSDTLADAFSIYSTPNVLGVRPKEGYSDVPTEVTVCSAEGFAPGSVASITVPVSGTIPLENQSQPNRYCIVGTVPVAPDSASWKGKHPITVQNACGATDANSQGYFRILPADLNDDLWGRSEELWLDPSIVAFANEDIKMGLMVHRRGGKDPLQNVTVRFYEGDPSTGNAIKIGDGVIPLLSPRVSPSERISGTSTSAVGWIPSRGEGPYTLYAVIDPDNKVDEDIEDNNVVSRTVVIAPPLPPEADAVAPRVDLLVVGTGNDANVVYDENISLHVEAHDLAQQNVTPSGVKKMYFVEYMYNQAATVWEPVQTSGWLSYTQNSDWRLVPMGGLRFMQAWAVDNVGKISRFPYVQRFNYIRPCERVSRNGTRTYSQQLKAGDILEVQVSPCKGDPDLYIWPPDWEQGAPPYVSNQYHDATEYISFTASIDGIYQVEVYGYSPAEYDIQMEVLAGSTGVQAATAAAATQNITDKPQPSGPTLPADSAPLVLAGSPPEAIDFTPSISQNYDIYLPVTIR